MNRRNFITGIAGILAAGFAPTVLPSGVIMPIRKLWTPDASFIVQIEPQFLNGGKGFIITKLELIADPSDSVMITWSQPDYSTFKHIATFKVDANQQWRSQALVVDWTPT